MQRAATGTSRVGRTISHGLRFAAFIAVAGVFSAGPAAADQADAHRSAAVTRAPHGSVNIYRDDRGIPHLYAEREEDGWFGLGYAHAEDRLEGLLLFYLMLRGELSAKFGPGPVDSRHGISGLPPVSWDNALSSDRAALRGGFLASARQNLDRIEPQIASNMRAYVAGIQRYMAEHPDRVPAWAPVLEPALPLAAEALMMDGVSGAPPGCEPVDAPAAPAEPGGSNILAVSGTRTPDGAALFGSDSHGPIAVFGTFFHPARIVAGPVDAFLVDIVGLPIGLKGHGSHFAWGWAESPRHPSDCLRVESFGPKLRRYRFDGDVHRFQVEPYRLKVAGGTDEVGEIETSRHNGVRSVVMRREGSQAFVQSSIYAGRAGYAATQFRAMLLARDWPEMISALEQREIYPANIAVAGPDGGILYARPGRFPVRPAGSTGIEPVDGNSRAMAWQGIWPFERLVQLRDPVAGYVANANVSPDMMYARQHFDPADYPVDFGFEPGRTGTRQRRAIALMEHQDPIDIKRFLAIVGDVHVPGHEHWARALAHARGHRDAPLPPNEEAFHQLLLTFDGDFLPQSRPALAHAMWRLALRQRGDVTALPVEIAIAQAQLPDAAGRDLLVQAARDAMIRLEQMAPAATFGDMFRNGRGQADAPSRGLTLLPMEGDPDDLTDFGTLWSSVYAERASDGLMVHRSGTRLPFVVHMTQPVRSYSHLVHGIDDRPGTAHHDDQADDYGRADFRPNRIDPNDLATHLTSARTIRR